MELVTLVIIAIHTYQRTWILLDRIYMFSLPIDSRHPYWIGSTVWRLYKFFTSVFRAFNFSTLFSSLGIHLVPVLENSSDNPSIMFSKLFHGERNSLKAVLFVWHTSVWKVLTHVCRSSWSNMVSFRRCLSINNTMCTGMCFMVNWLWFTKSVIYLRCINPSHLSSCFQNTSLHP